MFKYYFCVTTFPNKGKQPCMVLWSALTIIAKVVRKIITQDFCWKNWKEKILLIFESGQLGQNSSLLIFIDDDKWPQKATLKWGHEMMWTYFGGHWRPWMTRVYFLTDHDCIILQWAWTRAGSEERGLFWLIRVFYVQRKSDRKPSKKLISHFDSNKKKTVIFMYE